MIKRRDINRGSSSSFSSNYSKDLLVCFPSRTHHLALTHKPISSPSRSSSISSTNRTLHHRRHHNKLSNGGYGSPVLWAKQASRKNMTGDNEIAEPTSPKVTCAGQIKLQSGKYEGKRKNWQSVMQEIENIHNNKSQNNFFGLRGFLTCLKNIKFELRCFGNLQHDDVISDDDEEDDEDQEEENSKTVFSKWFTVLQEEQRNNVENANAETAVPPQNALLLMRCRSAPAKSWLEEKTELQEETEDQEKIKKKKKDLRSLMEEEKMELVLMRYDNDYYKLSSDIAKETWVVGDIQDSLSRSRSWKS